MCRELSAKFVKEWREKGQDYTFMKTGAFYSQKLDACIHYENAEVGVDINVYDISKTFLPSIGGMLLHCDTGGANSVILGQVRKYRGQVFDVPYKEFLDNGFGGPPVR
jgi:hypothetical protein